MNSLGYSLYVCIYLSSFHSEKGMVTTELEGNPNSPRKTVSRVVGKHTTHNSSVYSDSDEDDDL